VAGAKEGEGKYRYADGKYYEGQWQDNKMEGRGEMHWDDQNEEFYKGMWANNQRTGDGT